MDEKELTCIVVLNDDKRPIAVDCEHLETDVTVTLKRGELPTDYLDFCRNMLNYQYLDNHFVLNPFQCGMTEKKKQEATLEKMMTAQKATFLTTLEDKEAVKIPLCYPKWASFIGKELKQGERVEHEWKLWKVRQNIPNVQAHQPPSIDTASLYERIDVEHAGTIEDPIPYASTMAVFKDKYYVENGIKYKCIRDSGTPLYASCESLVGNYFELVN